MRAVIKQFFLGTLQPPESSMEQNSAYMKKSAELLSLEEQLLANLRPREREQLLALCEMEGELCSIEVTDSFVDGFRLGALFMQDIMYKYNNNE